jgi:hypothetical protein
MTFFTISFNRFLFFKARFRVGQNIAISMSTADDLGTSDWAAAVADWYSEVEFMTSAYVASFP